MNRRTFLQLAGTAGALPAVALRSAAQPAAPSAPRSSLPIYQPNIETGDVYFQHPNIRPQLHYNHDADLIRFKGRYVAAWNANSDSNEGASGQFNYVTYSDDLERWVPPFKAFTTEGKAVNPVDSDNQWQPAFINDRDETLFCAWSDYHAGRTFVSSSRDGLTWTNVEVPRGPAALADHCVAYPATRGLVSSSGTLMFPCCLPPPGEKNIPDGKTIYAGILISKDRGKSWTWSEPIGADPGVRLWEPTLFELQGGRFGITARNVSRADPHRMLLAAWSDDGVSWGKAAPAELDLVCTRSMAISRATSAEDFQLVSNDWRVQVLPDNPRISKERYFLALFCGPTSAPDLLLPGPVVQPAGGRAYYPSGFVDGRRLYLIYTYVENPGQNNCIHRSVLDPMPDYSRPFLLPRGGRSGLTMKDGTASLQQRYSSLGLVLTAALTHQSALRVSFRFRMERYDGNRFVVFTVGGVTRNGAVIAAHAEPDGDVLDIITTEGATHRLGPIRLKEWHQLDLELGDARWQATLDQGPAQPLQGRLLRKLSFGGLYEPPEWPLGMIGASDLRIDLSSIKVA